jgi:hypothetical protein
MLERHQEVSIRIGAVGVQARAKASMMIMRLPQQGHG